MEEQLRNLGGYLILRYQYEKNMKVLARRIEKSCIRDYSFWHSTRAQLKEEKWRKEAEANLGRISLFNDKNEKHIEYLKKEIDDERYGKV